LVVVSGHVFLPPPYLGTRNATAPAYTPGPWKQYFPEGQQTADWVIDHDGRLVASVHPSGRHWNANARLIAAAPALLEACKAFVNLVDEDADMEHTLNPHDEETCSLCLARAAIANAEGRCTCGKSLDGSSDNRLCKACVADLPF